MAWSFSRNLLKKVHTMPVSSLECAGSRWVRSASPELMFSKPEAACDTGLAIKPEINKAPIAAKTMTAATIDIKSVAILLIF